MRVNPSRCYCQQHHAATDATLLNPSAESNKVLQLQRADCQSARVICQEC